MEITLCWLRPNLYLKWVFSEGCASFLLSRDESPAHSWPSPLRVPQETRHYPTEHTDSVYWIGGQAFALRSIDIFWRICGKDVVASQLSEHQGSYFRSVSSAYVVLFLPQNALLVCELLSL